MSKVRLTAKVFAAVFAVAAPVLGYYEGRSLFAYLDPVGIPTICEGITAGVKMGDIATPEQCDAKKEYEARKAFNVVALSVTVPISIEEAAAYTSFVYNVGPAAFKSSTLLRVLNNGDRVAACNQLSRWVYAGGRKLKGLERRRETERKLCLSGVG
jgi:lysozyme